MPKWLKVVLIGGTTVFLLLVVTGFIGAKALKDKFEDVEKASEKAEVDGEVFGMTSAPDGCLEESVHRGQECGGFGLTCLPPVNAFLWACIEESNYDSTFCDEMPSAEDDQAMMDWGRRTCDKYGQPDDDMCAMTMATITGFCELKRQEG